MNSDAPRRLLTLLALLTASHTVGAGAEETAATRPNVVLIMTDDQGYGDFGVTGNPVFETPNIDALARESAWMKTFYVSPVCSPTRAALMTGRYNQRTRVIDTWLGRSMMEPEEVTLAEVLRGAGYATGIFGKWHLGDCYPMRPIDQGFEEALVHRGGGLAQPSEPRENARRYTDPILLHNGKKVHTTGYCTDVYFRAGTEFIEKSHAAGRPFFVYLPTNAPHGPYHDVPEDLRKRYMKAPDRLGSIILGERSESAVDRLARIAAMVTNVDQNVGRLLERLNDLGIARNTLVIFLVDNGPNTRRYVGPLRGMKSEVHEGGIRSPLWMRWPARLKGGTARPEPVAHIDIVPTVLEACGVSAPADLRLDGRSFLGLLTGERTDWPERTLVIQTHRGDRPVRYHHFMIRNSRWKLLHASGFGRESFAGEPRFELYDLTADPGESRDLAAGRPDVVARLRAAYDAWFDDVSGTRPDTFAPPRIHVGSPRENPTVLTRQDWRGGTWAPRAIGHWLLRIERPGTYDVRLLIDPAGQPETATLTIDGVKRRLTTTAGDDEIRIEGLDLEPGDVELHAVLERDGKGRGVYQVILSRRQSSAG